jgi:hypothetical protein
VFRVILLCRVCQAEYEPCSYLEIPSRDEIHALRMSAFLEGWVCMPIFQDGPFVDYCPKHIPEKGPKS